MIFAVALKNDGASSASAVARETRDGESLRVGGSAGDDLYLPGLGATALTLAASGGAWRATFWDGGERVVADGEWVLLGVWSVLVLLREEGTAEARADDDLPYFELGGSRTDGLAPDAPALLGSAPWCSLRLAGSHVAVVAVALLRAPSGTTVYRLPGVELDRNGERVPHSARLADSDTVAARGGPPIRYRDPQEELDRLLGVLRDDEPPPPDPPPESPKVALVTYEEAVLWAAAAAVLVTYVAIFAERF